MLARDATRIEDVDRTGPDHGADAICYGCLRQELAARVSGKFPLMNPGAWWIYSANQAHRGCVDGDDQVQGVRERNQHKG